jgi:hypothetical protein
LIDEHILKDTHILKLNILGCDRNPTRQLHELGVEVMLQLSLTLRSFSSTLNASLVLQSVGIALGVILVASIGRDLILRDLFERFVAISIACALTLHFRHVHVAVGGVLVGTVVDQHGVSFTDGRGEPTFLVRQCVEVGHKVGVVIE